MNDERERGEVKAGRANTPSAEMPRPTGENRLHVELDPEQISLTAGNGARAGSPERAGAPASAPAPLWSVLGSPERRFLHSPRSPTNEEKAAANAAKERQSSGSTAAHLPQRAADVLRRSRAGYARSPPRGAAPRAAPLRMASSEPAKEPQSEPAKEPQPESPLLSREKKKNPLSFRGVANMAAKVKSAAHLSAELDRTKSERIVSGGDPSKGHNWQIRHGRMTFTGNAAARLPHPTAPLALVLSSPLP